MLGMVLGRVPGKVQTCGVTPLLALSPSSRVLVPGRVCLMLLVPCVGDKPPLKLKYSHRAQFLSAGGGPPDGNWGGEIFCPLNISGGEVIGVPWGL